VSVERKYERDIDLLLAEEFSVNPSFARWFRSKTKFSHSTAEVESVFVSKSDNTGESDLVIVFAGGDKKFAILIEDKIDAPVQPDQAQRYRLRADKEIAKGAWSDYVIVLCAPRYYVEHCVQARLFDQSVHYEDIGAWLKEADQSARGQYRANFILTSASRRSNTWSRIQDDDTDQFWSSAYDLGSRKFPDLEMKPLALTKGSKWITLRPRDLPTQPKHVYISLKADRGFVDLTFANTLLPSFDDAVRALLAREMTVHQTGASVAIRLKVEGFVVAEGVTSALPKIEATFAASRRLIAFYRANRAELDAAAKQATPMAPLVNKGN